jgi:hypothetical protein
MAAVLLVGVVALPLHHHRFTAARARGPALAAVAFTTPMPGVDDERRSVARASRSAGFRASAREPAPPAPPTPPTTRVPVAVTARDIARPRGNGAPSGLTAALACLRRYESGGNYATSTGNGYYGAYQFSLPTWWSTMARMGLGTYTRRVYVGPYPRPNLAPPGVQDAAAANLHSAAGWGQWPVTSRRCGLR